MKKFFPILIFLIISVGLFEYRSVFAKGAKISKAKATLYESRFLTTTVVNLKKEKLSLKNLKSKIIILNFWASWCLPCISEFKSLVELKARFKDHDIRVIAVNGDDENQSKSVQEVIDKHKLNFDIVLDKNSELMGKFNITAIPVSIIFYKGKVIEVSNGAKDFSSIESVSEFKKYINK